jgi:hypothetical protein
VTELIWDGKYKDGKRAVLRIELPSRPSKP